MRMHPAYEPETIGAVTTAADLVIAVPNGEHTYEGRDPGADDKPYANLSLGAELLENGHLRVRDVERRSIAMYAPGQWLNVRVVPRPGSED